MINEYIRFSTLQYSRDHRCGDCPNDCPETGNCEQCLENIHYGRDGRSYNCTNILSYYVGKYAYKYASEIGHVFNFEMFNLPNYKVLSLGCGPCTDIFGILQSLVTNNRSTPIKYLGIDINSDWRPIYNWISTRASRNFNVLNVDVFNFLENPNEYLTGYNPNIIIINYLISDLIKTNKDICHFVDLFESNLFRGLERGTILIVNDYNRGMNQSDPRTYYSNIVHNIRVNSQVECFYSHFAHNYNRYYVYGYQHASNQILFSIEQEFNRFNPWLFCSSAQLIIKKS